MAVRPMTLSAVLDDLDTFTSRVPLAELTERMRGLEIDFDELAVHAHFGRDTYQRNLVRGGPAYSALVLCWRAGQRSPIHDHFGSSCGVRVLRGVATETFFERTAEGHVYATSTRQLHEGEVCGSQDDDLHQMSNLQPAGRDLITLHIYSPPLIRMGIYSLTDTIVRNLVDPIVGLTDGAGI